ncbi:GNAT family N-acetyltransferase [Luedemannella helvata]|uniref:N-acetyltransferase domain-containing protein n=1 Tax=Luedemannella helvata TaxID=349315 RepID=A0ABP4WZV6_9ACTN
MIESIDYRPSYELDADLAELAYAAVRGWPDQQAITPAMIRSRLRPTGTTATTLLVVRDGGRLVAAAAMLWPATLEATGELIGPLVHPSARGAGLGTAVLRAAAAVADARPGIRFTTGPIPESRSVGWNLFEKAGWHPLHTANLLAAALPVAEEPPAPSGVQVRAARPGEYLNRAVADLILSAYPHCGHADARDMFVRWTTDERYRPDGLLLAGDERGLSGAALVYPQSDEDVSGPPEAVIADLVVHPHLDSATASAVRAALAAAAARVSASFGAVVARTVAPCPFVCDALASVGFRQVDQVRYYGQPASRPVASAALG